MFSLALAPVKVVEVVILVACLLVLLILTNVFRQILFKDPSVPPVVFHWIPIFGSAVAYGMDPFNFFLDCQKKVAKSYGDVFTFILLGRRMTVYLGPEGNRFILHASLKDVNAEEIYDVLTTPVFGTGVAYDVPNAKFMEQKKLIMSGLTKKALRSYVPLMQDEVQTLVDTHPHLNGNSGTANIPQIMAQITLFSASRTLQGKEVRSKLDSSFMSMYHALDEGLAPINFIIPWLPLPHKKHRDAANKQMTKLYNNIIQARRASKSKDSEDMIWNLMESTYRDNTPVPDTEIAHMMIALLMAGQESSSVTSSWVMLHLASEPQIMEDLYQEQLYLIGPPSTPLTYDNVQNLPLLTSVIRETLRLHNPIHSIMRKVKNPLPVDGTPYIIPPSHILLATPATMAKSASYFPDPDSWNPRRWEKIGDPKKMEKERADYGYGEVSTGADSNFLPFGAGRHRCIGEQFAMLQLTVVVSVLVRILKVGNLEGRRGVVGSDYSRLFSPPKGPALVRWERRKVDESM